MKPTYGLAIACLFTAATACSKATPDALAADTAAPATASATSAAPDKAAANAAPAVTPPTPSASAPDVTYRWETHKATNLKFELPTTWTLNPKGNVLVAQTPTPGVAIEFVAATGGSRRRATRRRCWAPSPRR